MPPKSAGRLVGVLGGALLLLAGFLTFVIGIAGALVYHSPREGLDASALAVEEAVVGILMVIFAGLGGSRPREYALVSGILLIVLAVVSYLLFGGAAQLLVVLGALLALVAGVLLIVPTR